MAKIDDAKALKAFKEAKTAREMVASWYFLTNMTEDEAMEQMKQEEKYFGVWIEKAPDIVKVFMHDPLMQVMERQILDGKTRELLIVAVYAAMRDGGGLSFHIPAALGAGATEDEVMETIFLTAYMQAKNMLSSLGMFVDEAFKWADKLQK